jgi:hypothetical protein
VCRRCCSMVCFLSFFLPASQKTVILDLRCRIPVQPSTHRDSALAAQPRETRFRVPGDLHPFLLSGGGYLSACCQLLPGGASQLLAPCPRGSIVFPGEYVCDCCFPRWRPGHTEGSERSFTCPTFLSPSQRLCNLRASRDAGQLSWPAVAGARWWQRGWHILSPSPIPTTPLETPIPCARITACPYRGGDCRGRRMSLPRGGRKSRQRLHRLERDVKQGTCARVNTS